MLQAHDLPCGHFLCWDCLNRAVYTIESEMQCWWDSGIRGWLEEAHALIRLRADAISVGDSACAQLLHKQALQAFGRAHKAAGFTCCGLIMRLDRFVRCMQPDAAQSFNRSLYAIQNPYEQMRCGWPDCRAFLPMSNIVEDDEYKYSCGKCEGNSIYISDVKLVPGW